MSKKLERLGRYLKAARLEVQMTQKQVAAELRLRNLKGTQSYIAMIEDGKLTEARSELLHAFATIYKVSYQKLVLVMVEEKYNIDLSTSELHRSLTILQIERDLKDLTRRFKELEK